MPPFDVQRLYAARDLDELRAEYERIATAYDDGGWDWLGPAMVVEQVQRLVPRDALQLDVGAGTGQLGVVLRDAGYLHVDAMEIGRAHV